MKTTATPLSGVIVVELDVFSDPRGSFRETFQRERYAAAGIAADFVQDNLSSSVRGTLRGLHYQRARPQGKLVHVVHGEVFDVTVDIRRGSPTYGRWYGVRLSRDNHLQVWIPPGFAHGFLVVSDTADLVYKTTDVYVRDDERAIRWDDEDLAIAWPVDGAPVLSERDRSAPRLRDADVPRYAP